MNNGIDLQTYLDNLSDDLQAHWDEMLTKDTLYPVGSIFHSTSSTSPASLFGGSWTQIQGRMLIGQNSTYTNMGTGGEATHKLTTNEMPAHKHTITTYCYSNAQMGSNRFSPGNKDATSEGTRHDSTRMNDCSSVGGGQAHNNMPPWYGCYIWRRTA